MSKVRLKPPSDLLLEGIAGDIDEVDARELLDSGGSDDHFDTLVESRDCSFECLVATVDDIPVAVFGIALTDESGTTGVPWAVFTNEMRKYPKELMASSRTVLDRWSRMFPYLENYVASYNVRAKRWLERLGFTIHEVVEGLVFQRFTMSNV